MPYKEIRDEDLKIYWGIGEIAKELNIYTSTIRYWQTEFPWIKSHRDTHNTRRFNAKNREKILKVNYLLHKCGMTIEGVRRAKIDGYLDSLIEFFKSSQTI